MWPPLPFRAAARSAHLDALDLVGFEAPLLLPVDALDLLAEPSELEPESLLVDEAASFAGFVVSFDPPSELPSLDASLLAPALE